MEQLFRWSNDIFSNNQLRVRKQPSLKVNALSNWIALGVNIAVSFCLMPAVLAHLGEKRFGMWTLVSCIVGYFGLLKLGIGTSVLRYVPLFRGKGYQDKVSAVVSTGMIFYVGVGLLILIVSWIFADFVADFFQGGREFAVLVRVVGIASALECVSQVFDAAIRGYEGFVWVNLAAILGALVRAGGLFGCIFMGYGLAPMGFVLVIVSLIVLIAKGAAFRRYCKDVRLNMRGISLSVLKLLVVYGLIIMVEAGANLLTFDSPMLIVGKIVSLETVGFFGIACLLMTYYRRLIYGLTRVLMPRFSYLSGQNAAKEIRRLFFRASRYVTIVAGAMALLFWSVGHSFLILWIKNDNISQVIPSLMILVAGTLVLLSHRISIDLLYGLGKQKTLAVFAFVLGLSLGL